MNILRKDQLAATLHEEKKKKNKLIESGRLKDSNPLDVSESFDKLCEACRRGDIKICQEAITEGVNINACDQFDYSPLILASLCGHYEVVQFLLESGALCERDTFQGERCLYNALNDRIRSLLLSYDYSKSTDPLQPFASHITSLLKDTLKTSDILVEAAGEAFYLHKFILSMRSPYFSRMLSIAPETTSWKIPPTIPPQAFKIAMKHMYLDEIPVELGGGIGTGYSEDEVLKGIDKIGKQLEIKNLWGGILDASDRWLARQRRAEEVDKGRNQLEAWFRKNVLKYKVSIDTAKVNTVRWDRNNATFADVLLRADEVNEDCESETALDDNFSKEIDTVSSCNNPRKSTLFPVHRAILIRSTFFRIMFSSSFREAQPTAHLQIISIDCSPEVLEVVLTSLYAETFDFPLDLAIDVLFAADLLLMEKLKSKAALVISALGNGSRPAHKKAVGSQSEEETIDIYEVVRTGWLMHVPKLEEFGARYFAYRLENYIDDEEFAKLIRESANQIKQRQETDSIELLDEIRYHLSQRFRLRFEDSGIENMMNNAAAFPIIPAATIPDEPTTTTDHDKKVDMRSSSAPDRQYPPSDADSTASSLDLSDGDESASEQAFGRGGAVRTLNGDLAGDEFASDAINYKILLDKIDGLLERLDLDA